MVALGTAAWPQAVVAGPRQFVLGGGAGGANPEGKLMLAEGMTPPPWWLGERHGGDCGCTTEVRMRGQRHPVGGQNLYASLGLGLRFESHFLLC